MLWCVDNAAALKCNGYGLESLLPGLLDKGGANTGRGPVCSCMGWCTLLFTLKSPMFNISLKLIDHNISRQNSQCLVIYL